MNLFNIFPIMFAKVKVHMHSGDDGFSFDDVLAYILVCIVFSAIVWVISKAKNVELEWRKRRKEKKLAKLVLDTMEKTKEATSTWSGQMFCPNCGTSIADEYKFCYKCGTKLPLFNSCSIIATENTSVQNTKLPIKKTVSLDRDSIKIEHGIHKKHCLLWRFLWGSNEESVVKCIWIIVLGVVISSVGYMLLDCSNVLYMRHGVKEYRLAEFLMGYIIHIIGMACITRYVVILLAKVRSGEYEPHNYGKRIKAYFVCLIFLVGWIMGKSSLLNWLEIDKPSFSVWEWIIICAILRTVWRTIMGEKDCKKSVLRERFEYAVLSIFLSCGLILPIIFGVATSPKISNSQVSYRENKQTSKKGSPENVSKTNHAIKHKQFLTAKFIDYCNNGHFIDASRVIHSVDRNDVRVQYYLGFMYENGTGVIKDQYVAAKWYHKAAEQGHADAQFCLGGCYYNGEGVVQDIAESVKWFRKAAEQELANAQCFLGFCYHHGEGVVQDNVEAVKWYRKAAAQENAIAERFLGACYYKGEGVVKDVVEAIKWYRKAAVHGNADAQYFLGSIYEKGGVVPKDDYEAVKWYRKAAEQGYDDAKKALKILGY